jgi:hypothetical protein
LMIDDWRCTRNLSHRRKRPHVLARYGNRY